MGASDLLRSYAAYLFVVAGACWLAVTYDEGSLFILWPALASFVGGGLLFFRPSHSLTWAWTASCAFFGLIVALYQVYASAGGLADPFAVTNAVSVGVFGAFAVGEAVLMLWGRPLQAKSE